MDSASGTDATGAGGDCRLCHHPDQHHVFYGAAIPYPTDAPYGTPGEDYVCLTCHPIDTSSGANQFPIERECQACHHPTGVQTVVVDIKPRSARNPFNPRSRGVLPVSILGSDEYDVTEIDVSSLRLEGKVAPLRWRLQWSGQGYEDLKLKFPSEAVADELGPMQPGQTYEVWLTGNFNDGSPVLGSDIVTAVPVSWKRQRTGRGKR
jgi:hypothetical protein